jgi:outer membrane protein assembly factor BamB
MRNPNGAAGAWRREPAVRIAALVIATATTTAVAATAQQTNVHDWPQFRRDTRHSGVNLAETRLSPATVLDLEHAWTFTAGGLVTASPAVVQGVLYVPASDGRVYALNAKTGALIWQSVPIEAGYPSPAVVGGRVFVGTGVDVCRLYALDAATGAVLWSTPDIGGGITSPAVAAGRVYVGAGTSLYALDVATGAPVWTAPIDGQFSSPAVAAGKVYIGAGNKMYAVDAATGATLWIANAGSPAAGVWSSPAVVGGRLYVGSNDFGAPNTYAFDAETGQFEWVAYNPYAITLSSPAVADGLVFIASTDSVFTAHDAGTGAVVWSKEISAYNSSPTVANGVIYAGGVLGLHVIDAATGNILKTFGDVGFPHYSSPVVVNGMVYVGSFDHNLYAFGLPR